MEFKNLKGKTFKAPNDGFYNLATGRVLKNKHEEQIISKNFSITGSEDELRQFARLNFLNIKEVLPEELWDPEPNFLVRTMQKLHLIKEPEICKLSEPIHSTDIEKIPKDLIDSLCEFSLFGLFGKCLVTNIVDADTIDIAIYVPIDFLQQLQPRKIGYTVINQCSALSYKQNHGFVTKFRCRLNGLDAIESSQRGGAEATAILTNILAKTKNYVWVECGNLDKYRRLLVTLYSDERRKHCINEELLNHPEFLPYDGKTKNKAFKELPKIHNDS